MHVYLFFFSSRRRHTRWPRDWSSDVCSSDPPKVLILDEPTRGVDVGAKQEIYTIMNELAKNGVAIIMISSELPEVLGVSDRIMVMHEGKISKILNRDEADQRSEERSVGKESR